MNQKHLLTSTLQRKLNKECADVPTIGRGNYFPTQMCDDLTPEDVPLILKYIDGFALYKVKTDYKNWTRKTSDL